MVADGSFSHWIGGVKARRLDGLCHQLRAVRQADVPALLRHTRARYWNRAHGLISGTAQRSSFTNQASRREISQNTYRACGTGPSPIFSHVGRTYMGSVFRYFDKQNERPCAKDSESVQLPDIFAGA
jgi:hypothetical protein